MNTVVSMKDRRGLRKKEREWEESAKDLFGESADDIVELINSNNNEGAITLTQKALLKSALRLIPDIENTVRENKGAKGVYSYNAIVSQVRELLADIQSNQDAQLIANSINVGFLQPAFISMAQYMVDATYRLKKELKEKLDPNEIKATNTLVDNFAKSMAQYMQGQYQDLSQKIAQRLVD